MYQVHDGDYSTLRMALNLPITAFNDLALGAMISTVCHEHVFGTTPQELEAELAVYPSTAAVGLSIINGSGEVLFSWDPYEQRHSQHLFIHCSMAYSWMMHPVTQAFCMVRCEYHYCPVQQPSFCKCTHEILEEIVSLKYLSIILCPDILNIFISQTAHKHSKI